MRAVPLLLATLLLGACAQQISSHAPTLASAGPAIVATGATVLGVATVDAIASRRTEKDCSVLNLLDGDPYCRSTTVPNGRPPVHCFKTLGGVDCYSEADPYKLAETGHTPERAPLAPRPPPTSPSPNYFSLL